MLPELESVRRILAVRLDNVGDVVMTGPALRALHDALPDAEIALLVSRAGAQVAPMLPWVSDTIVARPVWQDVSAAVPFDPDREIAFARSLRERDFDAAFVFTSFRQSGEVPGYVAYLAGIPIRVGHAPLFSGGVFSHPVAPPPDDAHQVDRNVALVEAMGIAVADRSLELHVPAEEREAAAALLSDAGIDAASKYVVVAPGASAPARRYPADRFGAVAGCLAVETGAPVLLIGHEREAGLVEEARTAAAEIAPLERVVSLVGRTSIPVLASILAGASVVVTNDSGSMHLADAFGTPQVVLYSGSDLESQWRPRRSPSTLFRRETACSPCYRFDCPYHLACLDVDPREVVAAARRLMSHRPTRPVPPPIAPSSAGPPAPTAA